MWKRNRSLHYKNVTRFNTMNSKLSFESVSNIPNNNLKRFVNKKALQLALSRRTFTFFCYYVLNGMTGSFLVNT